MLRSLTITAALASAVALAATYSTPHTFTAGSTIRAADMNENFQAVQTDLRRLESRVTGFVHTTTAANVAANWSCFDHPATNDHPEAIVTVTHVYNPVGKAENYDRNVIGVWYYQNRWCVYHEDTAQAMLAGKTFNVVAVLP